MTQSFFIGYGFSGILIAFLARSNALAAILVAFFVVARGEERRHVLAQRHRHKIHRVRINPGVVHVTVNRVHRPPRLVEQTRVRAEIFSDHSPQDSQRVAECRRREDAGVEKSIVPQNSVAKGNEIVQDRAQIGHQHRRGSFVEDDAVDRQPHIESLVAQHGLVATNHIGHETETFLETGRRLGDHRGIETHTYPDGEPPAVAEPAEIHGRFITI